MLGGNFFRKISNSWIQDEQICLYEFETVTHCEEFSEKFEGRRAPFVERVNSISTARRLRR